MLYFSVITRAAVGIVHLPVTVHQEELMHMAQDQIKEVHGVEEWNHVLK